MATYCSFFVIKKSSPLLIKPFSANFSNLF